MLIELFIGHEVEDDNGTDKGNVDAASGNAQPRQCRRVLRKALSHDAASPNGFLD